MHALFCPAEDARGYFLLMEEVVRHRGIPLALYRDRHAVFRASAQQRAGPEGSTQFARALAELGVRLILARSPQAKGRVERVAGTFQDRLVTELRLASTTTIAEAQAVLERFLPRFNARFAVAARQPEPAWRPLDPTLDLGAILAFRHTRSDMKYHWRTLQLLPGPERPGYAGAWVEVMERPGGAPSGQPEIPATTNGTAVNGASPRARVKPPHPPTPRQRRAGRPSARRGCRDSRCAPPPACWASPATPSAPTSAPAAHPGARMRHHLRATIKRARPFSLNP